MVAITKRSMPTAATQPAGSARGVELLLVFVVALVVLLIGASSPNVQNDEFLTLLASRSYQHDGTFRILEGEYWRARGFSALVGWTFWLFGRADVFIARLPSVLAEAALATALFAWIRQRAGLAGGLVAVLLLCLSSQSLAIAHFARFYSIQALMIWLGSIAVFAIGGAPSRAGAIVSAVIALACFAIALHLQVTTFIALVALFAWIGLDVVVLRLRIDIPPRILAAIGLVALAILAAGAIYVYPNFKARFVQAPLWAQQLESDFAFYLRDWQSGMPLLLGLFPLAVIVAMGRWPRETVFCLLMVAIPFVIHSIAGSKHPRYISYVLPFFFAVWSLAIVSTAPFIVRSVEAAGQTLGRLYSERSPRHQAFAVAAIVAALGLFALATNPFYARGAKSLVVDALKIARHPARAFDDAAYPPWTGQAAALRAAVGNSRVLVSADDLAAITYFRPQDLTLWRSRIDDIDPSVEFGRDFRTGRSVISTPDSISALVACVDDGVLIVPKQRWRNAINVMPATADRIEQVMTPVTPPVPGFLIFKWGSASAPDRPDCPAVRAALARQG
jgi:hypothetical protein